ncbi:MAG: glycosyltransferase [Arachidicoccus sp.]|nr:glycosyltransferase [Arachidicoccus sp.]
MNPESGGVCKAIRDIIFGMSELYKNCENDVVCVDNPESSFIKNDSINIIALGPKKTSWSYCSSLLPWLVTNYRKYDKVIVHGLWQYQSYAIYKAWKKYKFNYFVMPHGMLDPYFQKAKGRKIKALRNSLLWHVVEHKLINNAKGLLFTCEEEMLLAKTTFDNYKPAKEIIIGLGIHNPPAFSEKFKLAFKLKVNGWDGKPFWLFLSRIHPKKGVDILINAYLNLLKETKTLPQLIIAGPGLNTEYGNELIALAQKNSNILFPGMLSGDDKWGAFYESELFILPSHQENFGIAIVEAMACAKPVIITNKVNIWREINKYECGYVGNDDYHELLFLLKKWHTMNTNEKNELSQNAQETFYKLFSISKAASNFYAAIDESINKY